MAPTIYSAPQGEADKKARLDQYNVSMTQYIQLFNELGNKESKGNSTNSLNELKEKTRTAAVSVAEKSSVTGSVDPSLPDTDEFDLEWIHGYRGYDCRNNAFYFSSKDASSSAAYRYIVYPVATLGVVLILPENYKSSSSSSSNANKLQQRYFRGHTDDILSIAIQINKETLDPIVATGQQALGSVFIWDPRTMQTLSSITTKQKSVVQLAFSGDGKLLVT